MKDVLIFFTLVSNKTQQPQQHADMYSYYQQPANHSSYTFDPTTGFYYDSSTGLYYDANSGVSTTQTNKLRTPT